MTPKEEKTALAVFLLYPENPVQAWGSVNLIGIRKMRKLLLL